MTITGDMASFANSNPNITHLSMQKMGSGPDAKLELTGMDKNGNVIARDTINKVPKGFSIDPKIRISTADINRVNLAMPKDQKSSQQASDKFMDSLYKELGVKKSGYFTPSARAKVMQYLMDLIDNSMDMNMMETKQSILSLKLTTSLGQEAMTTAIATAEKAMHHATLALGSQVAGAAVQGLGLAGAALNTARGAIKINKETNQQQNKVDYLKAKMEPKGGDASGSRVTDSGNGDVQINTPPQGGDVRINTQPQGDDVQINTPPEGGDVQENTPSEGNSEDSLSALKDKGEQKKIDNLQEKALKEKSSIDGERKKITDDNNMSGPEKTKANKALDKRQGKLDKLNGKIQDRQEKLNAATEKKYGELEEQYGDTKPEDLKKAYNAELKSLKQMNSPLGKAQNLRALTEQKNQLYMGIGQIGSQVGSAVAGFQQAKSSEAQTIGSGKQSVIQAKQQKARSLGESASAGKRKAAEQATDAMQLIKSTSQAYSQIGA